MAAGRHAQRRPAAGVRALRRPGKHRRPASTRSRAATLVVVPLVLAGGTGAYAYWSASGTGSAAVPSATAVPITVTASATPPPSLFPGRTIDVDVNLANSNDYPVRLTSLTAVTVASSDDTACSASANITVSSTVMSEIASGGYTLPAPTDVAAGATGTASLPDLITMNSSALDACQGKTFTVGLTFSGSQV